MPWLVVLGDGSWVTRNQRFEAGVHEVDEATAEKARAAGKAGLQVFSEKPDLEEGRTPGPLKPEDFNRSFGDRGVRLKLVPPPDDGPVQEDEFSLPKDYPCPQCTAKFPSQGSRARHVEFHH